MAGPTREASWAARMVAAARFASSFSVSALTSAARTPTQPPPVTSGRGNRAVRAAVPEHRLQHPRPEGRGCRILGIARDGAEAIDEVLRVSLGQHGGQLAALGIGNPEDDTGRVEQRRRAVDERLERRRVFHAGELGAERGDRFEVEGREHQRGSRPGAGPRDAGGVHGGRPGRRQGIRGPDGGRRGAGVPRRAALLTCDRGVRLFRAGDSQCGARHARLEEHRRGQVVLDSRQQEQHHESTRRGGGNQREALAPLERFCCSCPRQRLRRRRFVHRRGRRLGQLAAVRKDHVRREQLLIAAHVGARTRVHLREVLQGSGGCVDAGPRLGRHSRGAQGRERVPQAGQRRSDLRGPEILSLTRRHVGLLRRPKVEDGTSRAVRLGVEALAGCRLCATRSLTLPIQIRRHAERHHEQHEQCEACGPTFHSLASNGSALDRYYSIRP